MQALTSSDQIAVTYFKDFSTLETKLIISSCFEIVFGNGLHGPWLLARKLLGLWLCVSGGLNKKNENAYPGFNDQMLLSESLLPSVTRSLTV